jgi:hypothetical protein
MSQQFYTGNPTPNIYPLPDPLNNDCFRFTNKTQNSSERQLYTEYWIEQINLYGQQVNYYVNNFSTLSADNFYGEQPNQKFSLPQNIIIAINLNENALLLSKYGILSDDEITAFLPISSFYQAFGSGAEPKSGDVFSLIEYGSDRINGRGPNYYEVTQRLDQDIAQINPLMGHYVWLIKAKRFEYSFEPGLSGEQANQQVYDDTLTLGVSGATKPYSYDVDVDTQQNVFDYTQTNNYDGAYGGYGGGDVRPPIPIVIKDSVPVPQIDDTGKIVAWAFRDQTTGQIVYLRIRDGVINIDNK